MPHSRVEGVEASIAKLGDLLRLPVRKNLCFRQRRRLSQPMCAGDAPGRRRRCASFQPDPHRHRGPQQTLKIDVPCTRLVRSGPTNIGSPHYQVPRSQNGLHDRHHRSVFCSASDRIGLKIGHRIPALRAQRCQSLCEDRFVRQQRGQNGRIC
jgi:hypothetical protein